MGHFYFIRHGQTVWNVENKICGATDSPLTEYGREQAKETGQKILTEGLRQMKSSALRLAGSGYCQVDFGNDRNSIQGGTKAD